MSDTQETPEMRLTRLEEKMGFVNTSLEDLEGEIIRLRESTDQKFWRLTLLIVGSYFIPIALFFLQRLTT